MKLLRIHVKLPCLVSIVCILKCLQVENVHNDYYKFTGFV